MSDRRRPSSTGRSRGAADGVDRDRLVAVLAPVVARARLDLEDVEVRAAGRRRIVRVLVDGERGVSLDEIAEVSRAVSEALDATDVLDESPYTLEVSSPGVDRPLTLPRHWRRNRGRLVRLTLRTGEEVTGRIVVADDAGAELDLDPGTRRYAYDAVARAVVQVEFRAADGADDNAGDGADDIAEDGADDGADAEGGP